MQQAKSLRWWQNNFQPHYVNMHVGSVKSVESLVAVYNPVTKQKEFPMVNVMSHGQLDVIFDTNKPLQSGDLVNPYHAKYELLDCIEQRPAKGDWSAYGFIPIWARFNVKLVES